MANNPATLYLPLTSNLVGETGAGPFVVTAPGPVRIDTTGFLAEDNTINYITNPRFVNNAGWSAGYFTGTYNLIENGYEVVRLDMNMTPGGTPYLYQTIPVVESIAHSQRWMVKTNDVGTRRVQGQFTWRNSGGSTITVALGPEITLQPGVWTEIAFPDAVAPTGAVTCLCLLRFRSSDWPLGSQAYVAQPQMERKAFLTSYAHGSMGAGYSWSGTANASTSSRATSVVAVPLAGLLRLDQGEIWIRVSYSDASEGTTQYAVWHVQSGANRIYLLRKVDTDRLSSGLGSNGNGASPTATLSAFTEIAQGMAYQGATFSTLRDGVIGATTTTSTGLEEIGTLYIGGNGPSGTATVNARVRDLMLFRRQLTTEERAILANAPVWSFDILETGGPIEENGLSMLYLPDAPVGATLALPVGPAGATTGLSGPDGPLI